MTIEKLDDFGGMRILTKDAHGKSVRIDIYGLNGSGGEAELFAQRLASAVDRCLGLMILEQTVAEGMADRVERNNAQSSTSLGQ